MCKVQYPFFIMATNRVETPHADKALIVVANTIAEARIKAEECYKRQSTPQVIYQTVEITDVTPQPVKFKKVDGVNEN